MSDNHQFTHCVIISNTSSTNYQRSLACITALRPLFHADAIVEYDLEKKDYEHPAGLLKLCKQWLTADTLLCIAGGDGTNSFVINTLLKAPRLPEAASQAAILPLWGGNANDLAYMANGLARSSNIVDVITTGKSVAVYPLQVEVKQSGKKQTELGVCYASFGASAYASYLMNRPNHRQRRLHIIPGARLVTEAINVFSAITSAKRFDCSIDGEVEGLHDLLFINGSRIAKINRAPAQITDKSFVEIRVRRHRPVALSYILSLVLGASPKKTPVTKRKLIFKDATWLQRDGEVSHIDKDAHVKVTRYEKPFYLLSTKL